MGSQQCNLCKLSANVLHLVVNRQLFEPEQIFLRTHMQIYTIYILHMHTGVGPLRRIFFFKMHTHQDLQLM